MRKLVFITRSLIFLILFYQTPVVSRAQDFGRTALRECWSLEKENLVNFTIASDNIPEVFLPQVDGIIDAIDKKSGKAVWHSELGGSIITRLITDQDKNKLYLASLNNPEESSAKETSRNYMVRALSVSTGITIWQRSFAAETGAKIHLLERLESLFIFTESGLAYCLDKEEGKILFETDLNFKLAATPFLWRDKIYLASTDKKLFTFSATARQIEKVMGINSTPSTILVFDDILYLGDEQGKVSSVSLNTGKTVWKTLTGAEINSITKVKQGLLVSSFDNYIYLFSERNGKRLWKRRLNGKSVGTPFIKDDVAVFCTLGGSDALFVELNKGKAVNQIFIRDENYFVNNPAGFNDIILFPTFKGLIAFGADKSCGNK